MLATCGRGSINRLMASAGRGEPRGGQFTFADGSVHYITPTIDPQGLEALATPNANDQVGEY